MLIAKIIILIGVMLTVASLTVFVTLRSVESSDAPKVEMVDESR